MTKVEDIVKDGTVLPAQINWPLRRKEGSKSEGEKKNSKREREGNTFCERGRHGLKSVRGDGFQELNVVFRVKLRHGARRGTGRTVDVELFVEAVIHDEIMSHSHSVWLHGVPCAVVVIANGF